MQDSDLSLNIRQNDGVSDFAHAISRAPHLRAVTERRVRVKKVSDAMGWRISGLGREKGTGVTWTAGGYALLRNEDRRQD